MNYYYNTIKYLFDLIKNVLLNLFCRKTIKLLGGLKIVFTFQISIECSIVNRICCIWMILKIGLVR